MGSFFVEERLTKPLEIKKSKRLKGQPKLQGDGLAGFQSLLFGALAEGPTRLENLPNTPWFKDILEDFIRMGYAQQSLDGQWVIHGGTIPVTGTEPLRIRHEAELLPLAAFLTAYNCKRTLAVDADCVSQDVIDLLGKILKFDNPPKLQPGFPSTPLNPVLSENGTVEINLLDSEQMAVDLEEAPALETSEVEEQSEPPVEAHYQIETPTGFSQKAAQLLRVTSQNGNAGKPSDQKWDDYFSKLIFFIHQLTSHQTLDLALLKSGPDILENLATHFEAPIKIDRNEAPEGDELARRIARQMRAAGKQESLFRIRLTTGDKLKPQTYTIPSDITQASAFCLAATLINGSDITLEGVPLSPSRAGFISALRRMGADIEVVSRREKSGEGLGFLRIRSSDLLGKRFGADHISTMRDEIFLLIVAASFAEGETIIRDISHLRNFRSDLLKGFVSNLKAVGVEIGEIEDGLVVRGRSDYDGSTYNAYGHPGLALACLVMALKSHGASKLSGAECLHGRFPNILNDFNSLSVNTSGDKP